MTVCVAAICEGGILFGASDRMLTSGDVEFEPKSPKIYTITNSIAMMIAGDASLQAQIFTRVFKYAGDRLTAKPAEWLPVADVANEYVRTYQAIRSERAEARLLTPLGLTLQSFIAQQKNLLDSVAGDLTKEIINFDMPGVEAIITGLDSVGAHIYVAGNAGVTCQDSVGFAAIGAGYWHANSQFMFAKHDRSRPLAETLLLTYAAKKRAEVAPGVGEGTDMFTMGPFLGSYSLVADEIIESVDRIYRRTRKRATDSVKKSNAEVTKYVEQLGKEAAQQQQTAPASQPATKADGKDQPPQDGEADQHPPAKPN